VNGLLESPGDAIDGRLPGDYRQFMLDVAKIIDISRTGANYTVHFSSGRSAVFSPQDFEPLLCKAGLMILHESSPQDFIVN
jgi:hypothetical protein